MNQSRPSWTLRNRRPLPKARTSQLSVTKNNRCNLAIKFYVKPGVLNSHKSLTVLPKWKMRSNLTPPLTQTYDFVYFTHLVSGCLSKIPGASVARPQLKLSYQKPNSKGKGRVKRQTVTGRIIALHGLSNDDSHYDRFQGVFLTLIVRLNNQCSLPKNLRKINLVVVGNLLPTNKFQYGLCDKTRSRFRACTDREYLQNPGRGVIPWITTGNGSQMCHIFYRRDAQAPQSYCSFDVTTA